MGEDNTNACSCSELTEKLDMIIEELNIIEERMSSTKKTRKKRAPSIYNIFMGECLREGKTMKNCAGEYRKEKEEL